MRRTKTLPTFPHPDRHGFNESGRIEPAFSFLENQFPPEFRNRHPGFPMPNPAQPRTGRHRFDDANQPPVAFDLETVMGDRYGGILPCCGKLLQHLIKATAGRHPDIVFSKIMAQQVFRPLFGELLQP